MTLQPVNLKFALFLVGLVAIFHVATGQSTDQLVKFSNPATATTPKGYSQLVEVDLGTVRMVILSGQVALDKSGEVVGKDDPKAQFEQIFRNIQALVQSAGGTMKQVVKLTYFVRDVAHLPLLREVRDRYISQEYPPASTAVEVSNLFRNEFLAEVEAIAIIPKIK